MRDGEKEQLTYLKKKQQRSRVRKEAYLARLPLCIAATRCIDLYSTLHPCMGREGGSWQREIETPFVFQTTCPMGTWTQSGRKQSSNSKYKCMWWHINGHLEMAFLQLEWSAAAVSQANKLHCRICNTEYTRASVLVGVSKRTPRVEVEECIAKEKNNTEMAVEEIFVKSQAATTLSSLPNSILTSPSPPPFHSPTRANTFHGAAQSFQTWVSPSFLFAEGSNTIARRGFLPCTFIPVAEIKPIKRGRVVGSSDTVKRRWVAPTQTKSSGDRPIYTHVSLLRRRCI